MDVTKSLPNSLMHFIFTQLEKNIRKNGRVKKRVSVQADDIEPIEAGDNVGPAQFSMFE